MSALAAWFRAYGAAFMQLLREPVATLFNLLALGCAFGLGLAAVVWLGEASLGLSSADGRKLSPQVTLVLRGNVGETARRGLEKDASAEPGVRGVRFVGRDAALRRLARDLGDARLIEGLGGNPLPDALVLTLAADLPEGRVRHNHKYHNP